MKAASKRNAAILSAICIAALTSCGNNAGYLADINTFTDLTGYSFTEITSPSETLISSEASEAPDSAALSEDAYKKLCKDYAGSVRGDGIWSDLTADDISVVYYYGTYDSGEVVVMYPVEFAYTCDMNYFSVAGYDFALPSGSYEITLHMDKEFIPLAEAYELGHLSDSDMEEIYCQALEIYPYYP